MYDPERKETLGNNSSADLAGEEAPEVSIQESLQGYIEYLRMAGLGEEKEHPDKPAGPVLRELYNQGHVFFNPNTFERLNERALSGKDTPLEMAVIGDTVLVDGEDISIYKVPMTEKHLTKLTAYFNYLVSNRGRNISPMDAKDYLDTQGFYQCMVELFEMLTLSSGEKLLKIKQISPKRFEYIMSGRLVVRFYEPTCRVIH
jgi:hypothetical protein